MRRRGFFRNNGGELNTFIGGIGSYVTSKAQLATVLSISESNITQFNIVGTEVQARIQTSYPIPSNAFSNFAWGGGNIVTYYRDIESKVTSIGIQAFRFQTNFTEIIAVGLTSISTGAFENSPIPVLNFPNCTSVSTQAFTNNSALITANFPICNSFGNNTLNDSIFLNCKTGATITVKASMATINAGDLEPDLKYARDTRGATITYI